MDPEEQTRALFDEMLECRLKMSDVAKCPRCHLRLIALELEMVEMGGQLMQKIWWVCPNIKRRKCLFPMTERCEDVYLLYRTVEEQRRDFLPSPRVNKDTLFLDYSTDCALSPSTSHSSQNTLHSSNTAQLDMTNGHMDKRLSSGRDSIISPDPEYDRMNVGQDDHMVTLSHDDDDTVEAEMTGDDANSPRKIRYVRIDDEEMDELSDRRQQSNRRFLHRESVIPVHHETNRQMEDDIPIAETSGLLSPRSQSASPDIDVVGCDAIVDQQQQEPIVQIFSAESQCARCRPFYFPAKPSTSRSNRGHRHSKSSDAFPSSAPQRSFRTGRVERVTSIGDSIEHGTSQTNSPAKLQNKSGRVLRRLRATRTRGGSEETGEKRNAVFEAVAKKNRALKEVTKKLTSCAPTQTLLNMLIAGDQNKTKSVKAPVFLDRVYVRPSAAKAPVNRVLLQSAIVPRSHQAMTSRFSGYVDTSSAVNQGEESGSATARTMTPPSETGGSFDDLELQALLQRKLGEVQGQVKAAAASSLVQMPVAAAIVHSPPTESFYSPVFAALRSIEEQPSSLRTTQQETDLDLNGELNDYFGL